MAKARSAPAVATPRWAASNAAALEQHGHDRIGIAISAAAAGTVRSRANSIARFWLSNAAAVRAGSQLARQQRQQRDADRDADHAQRQLVDPVGVVEERDRTLAQGRAG